VKFTIYTPANTCVHCSWKRLGIGEQQQHLCWSQNPRIKLVWVRRGTYQDKMQRSGLLKLALTHRTLKRMLRLKWKRI